MKNFKKLLAVSYSKGLGLGEGVEISDEHLRKINSFAHVELKKDDLYVRRQFLAHNAIDRDDERFSEPTLKDFAATLPGKGFLIGHRQGPPGEGLYYDAYTEEMSLDEAKSLTGEELRLPDGVKKVLALFGWVYTLKTPEREALLKDIDGGIVRHVSLGFGAAALVKVTDEDDGSTLYWEYRGKGEAREGSAVWLGAQNGAQFTKSAHQEGICRCGHEDRGVDIENEETKKKDLNTEEEEKPMKNLMKALGLPPATEEADAVDAVKTLQERETRLKTYEPVIEVLGEEITVETAKALKANAEDGKVYREDLIEKQVKFERGLGRVGDSDDEVKVRKAQLSKKSLDEIKGDIKFLEPPFNEKFPEEGQLETKGADEKRDNSNVGGGRKFSFRKKKEEASKS